MSSPVVIQCALTGSAPVDPAKHPLVPRTPAQIIESGLEAWRAGAAVLHIHARDEDGQPTQGAEWFAPVVDGLKAGGCDAILNLSCGTAGGSSFADDRFLFLNQLRPEMASFDCGTVNFGDRIFEGDVPLLRRMAQAFREAGTVPEIECFDSGYIGLALQLRDEGLLDDPLRFQFVVGISGSGVPATAAMIEHLRSLAPRDCFWSVCAPGADQISANLHCLAWGGHIRTGLEDSRYLRRGEQASNAQLVERIVRLAEDAGRPIATSQQAREILAIG